ncbi:MAG: DUF5009 domain-containing protein [Armatimonadetes bacterium]|nr:DUF5009 domain-containing protein [Armatimonadota bacterium]
MKSEPRIDSVRRVDGLDALRGLSILMMVFSGLIPAGMPAWMFHAQCPPPTGKFNPNIPGITWVDLVFPIFLFCLGAAIPLALTRRLEKGMPWWQASLAAFQRFFLLVGFAMYVVHIRPYSLGDPPQTQHFLRSILAFAALFPVLARLPDKWHPLIRYAVRTAGWALVIYLMWSVRLADGTGFVKTAADGRISVDSDIIIMILAHVALFGTLIWLATRKSPMMRVGAMGLFLAIRLSTAAGPSWLQTAWSWTPVDFIYRSGLAGPLFVALVGTLIGDLLLAWMREPAGDEKHPAFGPERLLLLGLFGVYLTVVSLVGLLNRHVAETFVVSALILALMLWLVRGPKTASERLLRSLTQWGVYCLMLGLLLEPYEGGIKKDPATLSYYFVCSGLAIGLLITFTIIGDLARKRWLALLSLNGQNPMIAYIATGALIQPILFLTGINPWINTLVREPWQALLHSIAVVLLGALVVAVCSRRKIYWRT